MLDEREYFRMCIVGAFKDVPRYFFIHSVFLCVGLSYSLSFKTKVVLKHQQEERKLTRRFWNSAFNKPAGFQKKKQKSLNGPFAFYVE